MDFFERAETLKLELKDKNLFRELKKSEGIDFCSNDYLGLSNNAELQILVKQAMALSGLGSTGSRLLRGHSQGLENLENKLADFCGAESSLFFPSGYQANLGLFSSLLKEKATVFSDEQIHASIIDGIRLSGCEKYIFSHNSTADLEIMLRQKAKEDRLNIVVVESVYSMSGNLCPLIEMQTLCEKYGASLIVDEAHSTGLFGAKGSGRVEELGLREKVLATVHTGGKALGVSGAWIAGSHSLIEFLVNRSRPFIYSTAPAFYQQIALETALDFYFENRHELKNEFFNSLKTFQTSLKKVGENFSYKVEGFGGPVTSFVLYENDRALSVMTGLAKKGFDVRAIRPPTVPSGQAQLRIIKPLSRSSEEVVNFIGALEFVLREIQ